MEKFEWKLEPNLDDQGLTKCIELDGFKHVYVDPQGKVHDLRPKATLPSYNNFMKQSEKSLYEQLIIALKAQLSELEQNEKYSFEDKEVSVSLREELKEAESNYQRINK